MFEKKDSVSAMLRNTISLKYKMIFNSIIVGIVTGATVAIYRYLGAKLMNVATGYYQEANGNLFKMGIVFVCLILAAIFVAHCVKKEPNISGSGIPQVEGILTRKMQDSWLRVLIYKFIGGLVCLGAGLSVGREGPSVQMGACLGEGVSQSRKGLDNEHKYLLTSGASAGLAAAFNAPLSGVMFALEEVHKNFSPIVLMSAMVSAVTAVIITKNTLGVAPVLDFSLLNIMPIKYYWSLVVLGIVIGISGYIFNHGILFTKALYKKFNVKIEYKIMIPFLLAGLLGMLFPTLLGGGHMVIMNLDIMHYSILACIVILIFKYIFTFICFGSGVPGGIFFPLLAIGAICGNIFGLVCVKYAGIPPEYLLNFAVLAMAGHFAATVKAPITGILLVFEMTGSFIQLLPLSIVVFTAIITSDLLCVAPIYDSLLDVIIEGDVKKYTGQDNKKTLIESCVEIGSKVENTLVSEIEWPKDSLVVSIQRGPFEIIPRGDTRILEGDLVMLMVNQIDSPRFLDYLYGLTHAV